MGNWKYYQLIATFYRSLFALISQGVSIKDATHRIIDDFWFLPEEKNVISNLVSLIQYINILFSLNETINIQLIDSFNRQVDKLSNIDLQDYLNVEELEHFKESIDEIKFKINNRS